jgi:cell division protein FtsZ
VKHIIDRVLELQEDEIAAQNTPDPVEDLNLQDLLKSLQPKIRVFGCGGAGSNAVARLEAESLFDDEYVRGMAINTDAQHLLKVAVENKILIGRTARGRGAGGDPEKGEQAAYESERILKAEVEGCDLAFITAGLGGGSGTGSAPVISRLAKQAGALTIAVVSYPFLSEGSLRKQNADWGLERLKETADTVIVLPNERLLEIDTVKQLPLDAAFRVAD